MLLAVLAANLVAQTRPGTRAKPNATQGPLVGTTDDLAQVRINKINILSRSNASKIAKIDASW